MIVRVLLLALLNLYLGLIDAHAHSGRTDASGCHHDRINGGYHCHNSPSSYSPRPQTIYDRAEPEVKIVEKPIYVEKPVYVDKVVEKIVEKEVFVEPKNLIPVNDYGQCEPGTYKVILDKLGLMCKPISPEDIPENSSLTNDGNSWECNEGFVQLKRDSYSSVFRNHECKRIEEIPNAHVDTQHALGWSCDYGYERTNNGCSKIEITQGTELHSSGNFLICKYGYGEPKDWLGRRTSSMWDDFYCKKLQPGFNQEISASGNSLVCKTNTFPLFNLGCLSAVQYILFILFIFAFIGHFFILYKVLDSKNLKDSIRVAGIIAILMALGLMITIWNI